MKSVQYLDKYLVTYHNKRLPMSSILILLVACMLGGVQVHVNGYITYIAARLPLKVSTIVLRTYFLYM